jgi:RNA polymerase sigma factor (sigma-70 family)
MQQSTGSRRLESVPGTLAFESFFEAERRHLFRALFLITGSAQEAEEIAQDSFLKVWERWDRISVMANPAGYLYRVAMNLSRSRFRRLLRAAKVPFSPERSLDPYGAADARDAVVRAIGDLSPRQRQALVLTDLLDRSTEEAAELMSVTSSTIRSLISEAHNQMRTQMGADDE